MAWTHCINNANCCCGGGRPVRPSCDFCTSLVGDPCYQGLCCADLPKISYKPFIPYYEPVRVRPRYSEKNVWHVWNIFNGIKDQSKCCKPDRLREFGAECACLKEFKC